MLLIMTQYIQIGKADPLMPYECFLVSILIGFQTFLFINELISLIRGIKQL
ncbi:MAG: hypothetical protein QXW83_03765 [Nitrososphaerales archaeon]